MDRPKVIHAIEVAKKDGLINEVMNNEKVSFRILDKGHQLLANSTEAVDLTAKECNQSDDCDSIPGSDYVEFKKFIHEEVLSLKALLSKQTISESGKNAKKPPIDYEAVFIRSLQDRILSLERQLDEKQKIIEKLLEARDHYGDRPNTLDTGIPVGSSPNAQLLKRKLIQESNVFTSTDSKPKDKVSTARNSTNKESPDNNVEDLNPTGADATVSKDVRHQKQKKGKNTTKSNDKSSVESENSSTTATKQATDNAESKKIKVLIVGDSQLRNVNNEKMENKHHIVEKKFKPGMRIKEAVKQTGKVDSDVIIVHAATNNVASTTPQELCKETMDTLGAIQKNNPKAKIAFSAVFRRKDSHELNSKVTQLNELLSEKLPLDGFDMIENDNILFSNLKSDGLHLNEGGVRKFAGNLNKFIKYC